MTQAQMVHPVYEGPVEVGRPVEVQRPIRVKDIEIGQTYELRVGSNLRIVTCRTYFQGTYRFDIIASTFQRGEHDSVAISEDSLKVRDGQLIDVTGRKKLTREQHGGKEYASRGREHWRRM